MAKQKKTCEKAVTTDTPSCDHIRKLYPALHVNDQANSPSNTKCNLMIEKVLI